MADEVEMTPVEPAEATPKTVKAMPTIRKPLAGATQMALKPGLRLPPKAGATGALKPGLKLPTQNALKPGLKLPPKTGMTQTALRPGLRLPTKPVIHKPGETVKAVPLPKPFAAAAPAAAKPTGETKPVEPVKSVEAAKPAEPAKPVEAIKPAEPAPVATEPAAKPVAEIPPVAASAVPPVVTPVMPVDTQGIGKLPTVSATALAREASAPAVPAQPSPVEQLKSVTQKLKGMTQQIPQQAILRKTGIIAEGAVSEAQKEAAKHKTARISLSEAIGVAPVQSENAPMKTIRIKRPIDIPGATATKLQPKPSATEASTASAPAPATEVPTQAATPPAAEPATNITQRKTLKIARPGGGAVRPTGKFSIKRPSAAVTAPHVATPAAAPAEGAPAADSPVADIADIPSIPEMPSAPVPVAAAKDATPAWLVLLSTVVQAAACVAIGALAWLLYQSSQTLFF